MIINLTAKRQRCCTQTQSLNTDHLQPYVDDTDIHIMEKNRRVLVMNSDRKC